MNNWAQIFSLSNNLLTIQKIHSRYAVLHFSLFLDDEKLDAKVKQHLQLNGVQAEGAKVTIGAYTDAKQFISDLPNKISHLPGKIWVKIMSCLT